MSGQQIIKPEDIRIFFDSKEEPAAFADAGENVVFYCMDCYGKKSAVFANAVSGDRTYLLYDCGGSVFG